MLATIGGIKQKVGIRLFGGIAIIGGKKSRLVCKYGILIADDNGEWCNILKQYLEQNSLLFEVLPFARNGEEAIVYIEKERPAVLILDLLMPKYDGLYIIEHVKRIQGYTPFIYIVSAMDTQKAGRLMKDLEVDYYSLKPIHPSTVLKNIMRLLTLLDDREQAANLLLLNEVGQISNRVHRLAEEYMFRIGAQMHLQSTQNTCDVLKMCVANVALLKKAMHLYEIAGIFLNSPPTAVERNIRSTIGHVKRNGSEYFSRCFPYAHKNLSNTEFIHTSTFLLKRLEENSSDKISGTSYSELYR